MSCIHYKFKSSLDYNSVTFDGLHLSLADLKKAISQQKRLKPGEFDLEITNAQTGDVYKRSDELIAKNTSVIVSRVPVTKTTASSTQKSWEAFKQECAKVKEKERQMTLEKLKQTPDLAHAPASEIDKIKAVIDQSTKGFEPSNFVGKHQSGVPHDNYVCKRCGQKGHFIANCPNSNPEDRIVEPRYKRTTGIPSTMLTIVDDPMHPGALLTHHGQFAVPTVDVQGYREVKKERPPFLPGEKQPEPEKKKIPQELLCHICEDLCVDAAIAPCCGTSFCDECLREVLLESEDHQCPSCKETNVSPDRIVANRSMRLAVTNFLNDTGYTKAKRRRSNSTGGDAPPQSLQASLPQTGKLPTPPHIKPLSALPDLGTSPISSPDISASPTYSDSGSQSQTSAPINSSAQSNQPEGLRRPGPYTDRQGYRQKFNPQYSLNRTQNFAPNQFTKPWRHNSDLHPDEPSTISTVTRRNEYNSHRPRSHLDEPPPAADNREPAAPGTSPVSDRIGSHEMSHAHPPWPPSSVSMMKTPLSLLPTSVAQIPATTAADIGSVMHRFRPPIMVAPSLGHIPFQGIPVPRFPIGFPGPVHRLPLAPPHAVPPQGGPLSKEEFYQAKKMFQAAEAPKKKPVDVFDSFADFTKRRSRSPEKRRRYSRSRSGSWNKRSNRSRSLSVGKRKSRSLSPRRLTSRSRSRTPRKSKTRSRSRSLGPLRLSRQRSRTRSLPRRSKSRSRSRSGQRHSKNLSPRGRSSYSPLRRFSKSPVPPRRSSKSPYSPLRRSSKSPLRRSSRSPLPPLRSRSRSFRRTRSRSKSWTKRARSRSISPRPLSRSPRRSPRRSLSRSPFRKRSFSPRRKSRSFSPRKRSPFKSMSRSPLSKRKSSRSRSRSPLPKKRSFSPKRSPKRSKSPCKRPLSPIPFRRRSVSPFRGRGGYNRGRGRGNYGYRDYNQDNRDRARNFPSPPRGSASPNTALSATGLPPVPYFPQMGIPPPEEYFKYNPQGYQEFVRNFYAQFGNQGFPLPAGETQAHSQNTAAPSPLLPGQRPPWESVPMSPSQRPRSITPPGGTFTRERKDQNLKERDSGRPLEKDRVRQDRERDRQIRDRDRADRDRDRQDRDRDRQDRDRDRQDRDRDRPDRDRDRQDKERDRDRERDRRPDREKDLDRYRKDGDRRDRIRESDRNRGRGGSREREDRDKVRGRSRDKGPSDKKRSPSRKSKEEDKAKSKDRKRSERKREEKENRKNQKQTEADGKKESNEKKDDILSKTSPVSDKELDISSEQMPEASDHLKPKREMSGNEQQDKTGGNEDSRKTETPQAPEPQDVTKVVVKEKKIGTKKKGDGVTKKKAKDSGDALAGGEKKVKKTKKKKLTFGSSDADTKQGLKKKKLKRLVDYKSENYTSEDGEEKSSLGGSPLKRARLADNGQTESEVSQSGKPDSAESSHVSSSEPVVEVSAESKSKSGSLVKTEEDMEATVSQSESDEKPAVKIGDAGGKDGVMPELPELSKWERDDFDLFDAVDQPKAKPQEKMMLPRSVVDKAEKFLTHKPMKNAVMVAHVTTSTKSPESVTEKHAPERRSKSPSEKSLRRVFIDDKKQGKEKKPADLQITVKTDKRRHESTDKRGSAPSKSDDSQRHRHHHHENDYEEDQRSVIKSTSLERELKESKVSKSSRDSDRHTSRRDRESRGSVSEKNTKESSKKDRGESQRERQRDRSPAKARRHSKEASDTEASSKSAKDLRHKLDEKSKAKSAVDHRKLSVMDESEFVPDYEDLASDNASDNEHGTPSQNSGGSSPESSDAKDSKKRKREGQVEEKKEDDNTEDTDEHGKHKKKKKHRHKEKKEKHKHKKKKHKHKKNRDKDKEGKLKGNKDEES